MGTLTNLGLQEKQELHLLTSARNGEHSGVVGDAASGTIRVRFDCQVGVRHDGPYE